MTRRSMLWLVALAAPASVAHAFSEPTLYGEQTVNGGGGGRFFTGSPLDAYTCAVCHQGGAPPELQITGFPERYQPGETYDIMVRWTEPDSPHALNLEIVDEQGRGAGELALPAENELDEDDRCVLSEDQALRNLQASYAMSYGERTVIGVRGCGARSLHFTFTAPEDAKVALTASVLQSDGSEDPKGDGVLALRRVARRVGAPVEGPLVGSCATGLRASDGWSALALVALASLLRRRR